MRHELSDIADNLPLRRLQEKVIDLSSGQNLTFESRAGFPWGRAGASLLDANRHLDRRKSRQPRPPGRDRGGSEQPSEARLASGFGRRANAKDRPKADLTRRRGPSGELHD